MNKTRDITRSEWHLLRHALKEMDTSNFTRIGLETRESLLDWLEGANVGDWGGQGGRVTIVRND